MRHVSLNAAPARRPAVAHRQSGGAGGYAARWEARSSKDARGSKDASVAKPQATKHKPEAAAPPRAAQLQQPDSGGADAGSADVGKRAAVAGCTSEQQQDGQHGGGDAAAWASRGSSIAERRRPTLAQYMEASQSATVAHGSCSGVSLSAGAGSLEHAEVELASSEAVAAASKRNTALPEQNSWNRYSSLEAAKAQQPKSARLEGFFKKVS